MNVCKWTMVVLMPLLIGCEGAPPAASNESLAEDRQASTSNASEVPTRSQRETPSGEPANSVNDKFDESVSAKAAQDDPTLILVNSSPSHVDFYVDGYGPYRVYEGGSEYLTISVGEHTIDTYDRNGDWAKSATLYAEEGMEYTYTVWVE